MSSPDQPPDQQPQEQPPQQPSAADKALIAALLAILAAGVTIEAAQALVATLLAPIGIPAEVAAVAWRLAMMRVRPSQRASPTTPEGFRPNLRVTQPGAATMLAKTRASGDTYRAAYALAAARRITESMRSGKTLIEAIATERHHFNRHLIAQNQREQAARAADLAVKAHGPLLGWHAITDKRASPECLAADGKNFTLLDPPIIGLPGAVHPYCRCTSGPPFPNAETVNEALTRFYRI